MKTIYCYIKKVFSKTIYTESKKKKLSNYVTKSDLKNETGFNTSDFAKKGDLSILKATVYELDVDKSKMYQVIWTVWKIKYIN